MEVKINW